MFKKIFYSLTILAMLFGMFGVMGKGGVQTAQAVDIAPANWGDAYSVGPVWFLYTGVANPGSTEGRTLVGMTRVIADPTDCTAGLQTEWFSFDTASDGIRAPRYLTIAVRANFDASVVITNDAAPALRTTLGCFNVTEGSYNFLTVPITSGDAYNVMVAVNQGYPYVAETFGLYAMQSRNAAPIISDISPDLGGGTNVIVKVAADAMDPEFYAPYTEVVSDANGTSFFDLAAGDYTVAWSDSAGPFNWAMFRSVTAPAFVSFLPGVFGLPIGSTTTIPVTVYTDGGTNPFNLWLAPSDWVSGTGNLDFELYQAIAVSGCQGVAPDPAGVCTFWTEPGTYDAQLASDVATPYYDLATLGRSLTHPFPLGELLDFRATTLPQATIQLNSENAWMIDWVDLVTSPSLALGDWWRTLVDEDQLIVSANILESIEVRLYENGWVYCLDPVLFAGLESISRTFTPGEEVNITLDSGHYLVGVGVAPYQFNTTLVVPGGMEFPLGTASIGINMTNWVDVMGNVLRRVGATDDTLQPADDDALFDLILPNTLVSYGDGTVLSDLWTWAITPISVASPAIGRYHAQRVLLNDGGGDIDTGNVVYYTPVYPSLGVGDEEGVQRAFAVSPSDTSMSGHWAWSWVMALYEQGWTTGIGGGNFGPDQTMTRAQMAAFLVRVMDSYGVPAAPAAAEFADVSAVAPIYWAHDEIAALRGYGITSGCGGNNYCPDAVVTRAEMAKFIELTYRAIVTLTGTNFFDGIVFPAFAPTFGWTVNQDVLSPGTTFIDVPADHWANLWIEEMWADNLTLGCRTETSPWARVFFCPENNVTRGQMAKFIMTASANINTQAFWPVLAPER